jgi:hypothetical protein
MVRRLRLVKLVVQPMLVLDDGEHLEELTAQPLIITAAELDAFPERWRALLADQEAELNGPGA